MGIIGLVIGRIFGVIAGSPLLSALAAGALAWFIAYNVGVRDGTRDMVSKLEIASLEAQIANIEREKKIAEDAAKQAESDRAATDALAAQLARELNEYKAKLEKAGRKCDLTPDDLCDIYGLHSPQCKNRNKKHRNKSTGLAWGIRSDAARSFDGQRLCRPKVVRQCG